MFGGSAESEKKRHFDIDYVRSYVNNVGFQYFYLDFNDANTIM